MPDKIVLEHNGALGDFLLTWPAALALKEAFPKVPAYFSGKTVHARWLEPIGYAACPPDLRRELDGLYAAAIWPESLARTLVVRPGLFSRPDVPKSDNFRFLAGVRPGRFDPPTSLFREALSEIGIPWREDWLTVFRDRFGRNDPDGRTVLFFPGAGHRFKIWPLSKFLGLADLLEDQGFSPAFVLGPAEIEAGVAAPGRREHRPASMEELEGLLLTAHAAVGNDTGPMHLAGMLGVPGLAIFGPTSPRQWGPILATISGNCLRAPCAQVTAGDFPGACPAPDCLTGLGVQDVLGALLPILRRRP
jgi:ADP-heptose:LPS heptosyltransferase